MDFKTLLVWVFIGFFFLIMTNVSFAHCIKRDFKTKKEKTIWCIISLVPFLGFIIYFLFGSRKGVIKQ